MITRVSRETPHMVCCHVGQWGFYQAALVQDRLTGISSLPLRRSFQRDIGKSAYDHQLNHCAVNNSSGETQLWTGQNMQPWQCCIQDFLNYFTITGVIVVNVSMSVHDVERLTYLAHVFKLWKQIYDLCEGASLVSKNILSDIKSSSVTVPIFFPLYCFILCLHCIECNIVFSQYFYFLYTSCC